jgi:hypothetical protein
MSFSSVNFSNVTLNSNGTTIPVYAAPTCTTASGTLNMTSSQLSGLFIQPTKAGLFPVNANTTSTTNINSGVALTISSAAYYGVAMVAPPLITENECVPVTIQLADQYGNANPTGAPAVVTVTDISLIGNYAELFSNATCTQGAISLTVLAGQSQQYYIEDTGSPAAWTTAENTSPGLAAGSTTSSGTFFAAPTSGTIAYQTEPAGQAVAISLQLVTGVTNPDNSTQQDCLGVTLGTIDSSGNFLTPQGGDVDINLQIPSGSSWFIGQTACDAGTGGNASNDPVIINAAPWNTEIWISHALQTNIISASQGTGPTPSLMPATLPVPQ